MQARQPAPNQKLGVVQAQSALHCCEDPEPPVRRLDSIEGTEMAPLRIAFIHPDLGIGTRPTYPVFSDLTLTIFSGGAERLVVDAAVGLQKLGHTVDIYTSHHDTSHCFDETRDGRSQD